MVTETTIRLGSVRDIDVLMEIGVETFRDTFADFNTTEDMEQYLRTTFHRGRIAAEIEEPGSIFFLAEEHGIPVGYAKVKDSKTPEELQNVVALEIERLYARKDYIGHGVGKLLMKACLDYAKNRNYAMVWLGVWEHNQRAISFYDKLGFEKFGSHIFMLGNDAQTDFLMKKQLDNNGTSSSL